MQTVELSIMLEVARATGRRIRAFTPILNAEVLSIDVQGIAQLQLDDKSPAFPAPLGYMVGTPSNQTWRISPPSREILAQISTAWHIRMQVQHLYPHLATIREAYPDVKFYKIRDFRLADIRRHALIAQYGNTIQDVDSGPAMFKSFATDLAGLITYAEVEAWRYEPANIEALYADAI